MLAFVGESIHVYVWVPLLFFWNYHNIANRLCVCTKLHWSCPTLCDLIDCSLPDSSIHGILQERILEWIVMPSPRESSQPRNWTASLMSPALAEGFFITSTNWQALNRDNGECQKNTIKTSEAIIPEYP